MTDKSTVVYDRNSPAIHYLTRQDPALAWLVSEVGDYTLELRPDRFLGLARAVVGQQLSVAAAKSIWRKVENRAELLDVEALAGLGSQAFEGIGVSRAKATCLHNISFAICEGSLDLDAHTEMEDAEILSQLCQIKGIGRWTAEMYLIFSLGREDILSAGDAGLRRAAAMLIGRPGTQRDSTQLAEMAHAWAPYRTVASLYLWRGLDLGILR